MAITPLPTPPSRDDPANFADRADDFLGALPTFATEANALQTDVNAKQVTASTAATTATTQAGIATTQASTATTQAGIATTKASEALTSANNAAASFDSFDDRYLGAKSSNPTVDNDGNALLVGALYFNSVAGEMRVWSGAAWTATYLPAAAYATLTGTETLTNKTINIANNTLTGVQPTLVSGTNIKTVNSTSLLGSGDVAVQPTLVSGTNIKTVDGQSLLGSGNLTVGGGSMVLLQTYNLAGVSSVDVEAFSSTYDDYILIGSNITNPVSRTFGHNVRFKIAGSWVTTSVYNASYNRQLTNGNIQTSGNYTASQTSARLYVDPSGELRNSSDSALSFQMYLPNCNFTGRRIITVQGQLDESFFVNNWTWFLTIMQAAISGTLSGVRIFVGGNTITTGTLNLYGIKKS